MESGVTVRHVRRTSELESACVIVEVDGLKILVNFGTENSLSLKIYPDLEEIKGVTHILLCSSEISSLGGLLYLRSLGVSAPIYGTVPVKILGRIELLEQIKVLEMFHGIDTADIQPDEVFDRIVPLKYTQTVELSDDITVSPLNSGSSIGGAVWKIRKNEQEWIVCDRINHRKEAHLDGMDIMNMHRPSGIMINSTAVEREQTTRKERDKALIDRVVRTVSTKGKVFIPTGYSQLLEIVMTLHNYKKTQDIPMCLYSFYGKKYFDMVKTILEWTGSSILHKFNQEKENPFNLVNLQFRDDCTDSHTTGSVVFVIDRHGDSGFSPVVLPAIAADQKNLIIRINSTLQYRREGKEGKIDKRRDEKEEKTGDKMDKAEDKNDKTDKIGDTKQEKTDMKQEKTGDKTDKIKKIDKTEDNHTKQDSHKKQDKMDKTENNSKIDKTVDNPNNHDNHIDTAMTATNDPSATDDLSVYLIDLSPIKYTRLSTSEIESEYKKSKKEHDEHETQKKIDSLVKQKIEDSSEEEEDRSQIFNKFWHELQDEIETREENINCTEFDVKCTGSELLFPNPAKRKPTDEYGEPLYMQKEKEKELEEIEIETEPAKIQKKIFRISIKERQTVRIVAQMDSMPFSSACDIFNLKVALSGISAEQILVFGENPIYRRVLKEYFSYTNTSDRVMELVTVQEMAGIRRTVPLRIRNDLLPSIKVHRLGTGLIGYFTGTIDKTEKIGTLEIEEREEREENICLGTTRLSDLRQAFIDAKIKADVIDGKLVVSEGITIYFNGERLIIEGDISKELYTAKRLLYQSVAYLNTK